MLRYFRLNDPYRLLGVLVIGLIMFLPTLLDTPPVTFPELKSFIVGEKIREGSMPYSELVDSTAPLTCWFYGFIDLLFGRNLMARHILAFIIIFIQAAFMAIMCINRKVFSDSTYLPGLFFISLFAFSYDTIALTGELIGAVFLLLAINTLFKELEFRAQRDDTVLGLGLFISLASLCSFAYSVFLLAAIFALVFYSRRDLRILLLLVVGFALPHLLLICVYFLMGEVEWLLTFYYAPNLSFVSNHYTSIRTLLTVGIIPLVFFLVSLFIVTRETRLTKYQSQVLQSMFIWVIFSVALALYSKDLRPQSLIAVIPAFSFFLTHFFLSIQRKLLAELSIWFLLLGLLAMNYASRSGYVESVNYHTLNVPESRDKGFEGKRILVLSDDLSYFMNSKLATPFLNWELSRKIFTNADYYENVVQIYKGLEKDPPEYIVDPEQHMKIFFERSPEMKKKYFTDNNGKYSIR